MSKRRRTPEEFSIYFESKIRRVLECWQWLGHIAVDGYGKVVPPWASNGGMWGAHRVAWVLAKGPIPDGLMVLHRCDNRACVRVTHLFLGTAQSNVDDMIAKGRQRFAQGEQTGHATLTADIVREIRILRCDRESYGNIAKRFGVTRETARRAAVGISWRHVP